MRRVGLVIAALALAASASASARADTVHRRHVRTHAGRMVPRAPAEVAPVGAGPVAPEADQVGSAIDRTSAAIARASAASRAVTTDAFGPLLRAVYPPGQSGNL